MIRLLNILPECRVPYSHLNSYPPVAELCKLQLIDAGCPSSPWLEVNRCKHVCPTRVPSLHRAVWWGCSFSWIPPSITLRSLHIGQQKNIQLIHSTPVTYIKFTFLQSGEMKLQLLLPTHDCIKLHQDLLVGAESGKGHKGSRDWLTLVRHAAPLGPQGKQPMFRCCTHCLSIGPADRTHPGGDKAVGSVPRHLTQALLFYLLPMLSIPSSVPNNRIGLSQLDYP
jgi:hypothetical protein